MIIQNIDRAISSRDYAPLGDDLLVTSYFPTLQGEGPFAGYPAMFVRLAGCNYGDKGLHCKFCDTSFQFDRGTRFSAQQLLATLLHDPGYHEKQVLVITGGEPTLQQNLLPFIVLAAKHFQEIQIETNGTQPKFYQKAVEMGVIGMFTSVVSPKASTVNKEYPKVHADVMWWATCLKFVVTADPDDPHHTIPYWALNSAKLVYVSPMAVYKRPYSGEVSSIWDDSLIDREATRCNYEYAAKYAIENQLRLSVQTHLFATLA
jgi:organic radical activating enzyme